MSDLDDVVRELRSLEERLRELAYERLRAAADGDDPDAADDEKRILVARRALERAIGALAPAPDDAA
ncbi:MAG TPA: hypothetical protein VIH82_10290 [Acidimicrobiia bacterium]|jgi:hypothetical protein